MERAGRRGKFSRAPFYTIILHVYPNEERGKVLRIFAEDGRLKMRFYVNQKFLLTAAGAIWIAAGVNILRIGVVTWCQTPGSVAGRIVGATVVFALFFLAVFRRLLRKHTRRIRSKKMPGCPFSFFDVQGWLVMTLMIAFGILARSSGWLSEGFIAVFYTGLGAALLLTGALFIADRRKPLRR